MPFLNLKSAVRADAKGATFEAIELDLDGAVEPQVIAGTGAAQWAGELQSQTALTSKWLDLDLFAAAKGQQSNITGLKQLFVSLVESVAGVGRSLVRLDVEQVKFGGEPAGSLSLDAEHYQDAVRINRLKSGLPGGAHVELAGDLKSAKDGKTFSGEGALRGSNLARIQAFARKSGIDVDLKSEAPFWIAGRMEISAGRFSLKEAKAEIAGEAVAGDVSMETAGDRGRLSLRLEGSNIDSAVLFPNGTARVKGIVRQALGLASGSTAGGGEAGSGSDAQDEPRPIPSLRPTFLFASSPLNSSTTARPTATSTPPPRSAPAGSTLLRQNSRPRWVLLSRCRASSRRRHRRRALRKAR